MKRWVTMAAMEAGPDRTGEPDRAPLRAVLERSRRLGFCSRLPVDHHIDHALGFATVAGHRPVRMADLGSGGGLPGLVLAWHWPTTAVVLIEIQRRRADFLAVAATELGLSHVEIQVARAEEMGTDPAWRGVFDLVTARSFGPPAQVAECAAGLVGPDGVVVVSEPPRPAPDRWPPRELGQLGLGAAARHRVGSWTYVRIPRTGSVPATVPRPHRVMTRHPWWVPGDGVNLSDG